MPHAIPRPYAPAPRPLDDFANAVTAEIAEFEVAEAQYVEALGGTLTETADAVVVRHPTLLHPAFNGALHLTSTPRKFDAFLDRLDADFQRANVPYGIMTSPASTPYDAAERLAARGFLSVGARVWMEVEESVPTPPYDERISVRLTQDPGLWASTVAAGVGLVRELEFLRRLARESRESQSHRLLLASIKGVPAGACEVARDNGIVFVRHLAVTPPSRRQGVAHALLFRAFELAEELKTVRLATRVMAGSGVDRLFERYGFVGSHISETFVRARPPFALD